VPDIRAFLRSGARLGSVIGVRCFTGLGGILLSILISRTAGIELLGAVTFMLSAIGLLAFLARTGLDICLIKAVSRDIARRATGDVPWLLARVLRSTAVLGTMLVIVLVILAYGVAPRLGHETDVTGLLLLGALPLALLMVVSAYARATHRVALGGAMELGVISLIGAACLWVYMLIGGVVSATSVTIALLSVLIAMCTVALIWARRDAAQVACGGSAADEGRDWALFTKGKYDFMFTGMAAFVTQAGAFVVIGPFLTDAELGLARGAERLALLVSFPLTAVNLFISPRIVHHGTVSAPRAMRALMLKACTASVLLALPTAVALIWFPMVFLGLFGPEFTAATDVLVLLTVTQFITSIGGPFAMLLFLSGRERTHSWILVSNLVMCLVLYPLGSLQFGLTGFAVAYLVVNSVKAVLQISYGWAAVRGPTRTGPETIV